jgi:hypothetical protein
VFLVLLHPLFVGRGQLCCQDKQLAECLVLNGLEQKLLISDSYSKYSVDDYVLIDTLMNNDVEEYVDTCVSDHFEWGDT